MCNFICVLDTLSYLRIEPSVIPEQWAARKDKTLGYLVRKDHSEVTYYLQSPGHLRLRVEHVITKAQPRGAV